MTSGVAGAAGVGVAGCGGAAACVGRLGGEDCLSDLAGAGARGGAGLADAGFAEMTVTGSRSTDVDCALAFGMAQATDNAIPDAPARSARALRPKFCIATPR